MGDNLPGYLSSLNPEQLAAVRHEGKSLLILAGAGSGKTRVITTKIAYLVRERGLAPESVLAVTFTNKAAREMRDRAASIEAACSRAVMRTFHSFGAWFLRRNAIAAGLDPDFTIYDDDDSTTLLHGALPQNTRSECSRMAQAIARAKDYGLEPDSPDLSSAFSDPAMRRIFALYEERLRATRNVDFGDLIRLPAKLLRDEAAVRRRTRQRFRVVLVDEYQDSNVAQFELLRLLAGPSVEDEESDSRSPPWESRGAPYACVVGDDDQSIYRFRGAEVRNILRFPELFPGTDIIRLERNYRSFQSILDVAHDVVSRNAERLGKELRAERPGGAKPVLAFLEDQDAEVAYCLRVCRARVKAGGSWSDVAILYRTNAQSLSFEKEFARIGAPYRLVGASRFYDREEIKDSLAYLALLANGRDEVAFKRVVNKPSRGIGETSAELIVEAARAAALAAGPWTTRQADGIADADGDAAGGALADTEYGASFKAAADALADTVYGASAKAAAGALADTVYGASAKAAAGALAESLGGALDDAAGGDFLAAAAASADSLKGKARAGIRDFLAALAEVRAALEAPERDGDTLALVVELAVKRSGLLEYHRGQDEVAGTQKVANLDELVNAASLYPRSRSGLSEFLETIELDRSIADEEAGRDAVTLITMHNTKGLEFPVVIATGMEQGLFPRDDEEGEELEEQRRLFYVAITRAKDELHLTSCRWRRLHGRLFETGPSRFLSEIEGERLRLLAGSSLPRSSSAPGAPAGEFAGRGGAGASGSSSRGALGDSFAGAGRQGAGPSRQGYGPSAGGAPRQGYGPSGQARPGGPGRPEASPWRAGLAVYHEDYGSGVVVKVSPTPSSGPLVVVRFETGKQAQFFPKFTKKLEPQRG